MEKIKRCVCDGLNEECSKCGGKRFISDENVEIIRTEVKPLAIQKQEMELQSYLDTDAEKLYVSDVQPKKKGHKKDTSFTLAELTDKNHLEFIGPDNPNRRKKGFKIYHKNNKAFKNKKESKLPKKSDFQKNGLKELTLTCISSYRTTPY